MNTSGHYDVLKNPTWPMGNGYIKALSCRHCQFSVSLHAYRKPSDKGGQAKYNRARAVMVKHLHAEHHDILVRAEAAVEVEEEARKIESTFAP